MRVQKNNKAFAYRVPIGDYNYLQYSVRPNIHRGREQTTVGCTVVPILYYYFLGRVEMRWEMILCCIYYLFAFFSQLAPFH